MISACATNICSGYCLYSVVPLLNLAVHCPSVMGMVSPYLRNHTHRRPCIQSANCPGVCGDWWNGNEFQLAETISWCLVLGDDMVKLFWRKGSSRQPFVKIEITGEEWGRFFAITRWRDCLSYPESPPRNCSIHPNRFLHIGLKGRCSRARNRRPHHGFGRAQAISSLALGVVPLQ